MAATTWVRSPLGAFLGDMAVRMPDRGLVFERVTYFMQRLTLYLLLTMWTGSFEPLVSGWVVQFLATRRGWVILFLLLELTHI